MAHHGEPLGGGLSSAVSRLSPARARSSTAFAPRRRHRAQRVAAASRASAISLQHLGGAVAPAAQRPAGRHGRHGEGEGAADTASSQRFEPVPGLGAKVVTTIDCTPACRIIS